MSWSKKTTALVSGGALVLGAAIGAGGAFALWRTDDSVAAPALHWGQEYFAAGPAAGALTAANQTPTGVWDGSVALTVDGEALATTLLADGVAFQAFEVAGLSQGNKDLRYTVLEAPSWPDTSVLGNAGIEQRWGRVASAADCTATPTFLTPNTLPRELVTGEYTDAIAPQREFWCLTFSGVPDDSGTYDNTAGASASANYGGATPGPTVTATPAAPGSDEWEAEVTTGLDPAAEPDGTLTFGYASTRAGETP